MGMSAKGPKQPLRLNVPDTHESVAAPAREGEAVRGEGDRPDTVRVSPEDLHIMDPRLPILQKIDRLRLRFELRGRARGVFDKRLGGDRLTHGCPAPIS